MRQRKRWAILCIVSGAWAALAATPPPVSNTPTSYTRTVWRVSEGLPEDTVQALTEAPDGQLWIGTTGGMASFDGARIRSFRNDLTQASGVNSTFCLLTDRDGSLWTGTEGGGLWQIHGNETRIFSHAEGLTDGFVRSVYRDTRGVLWVGTDEGLFQQRGTLFVRIDTGSDIPAMAVHAITEDAEHRVWVGGSSLVSIAPGNKVTRYALPGDYSNNRVKTILQTSDATVWVGTVSGLARLQGGKFQVVEGPHATVRSLLQTADGTLWIGTIGQGLWTFRDGHLAKVMHPGLLPSETVLTMLQDDNGQIWIGTQAGLLRLDPTPVSLLTLPKAGDPDFETIAGDRNGDLWVAAQTLYNVHSGAASAVHLPRLGGVSIRNVYRARDGALWVGTDGSGAYRLAGDAVRHYSAPAELTNNFVRAFLETRSGEMWIATDEGVSAIGPNTSRKYTQADGLVFFSTRCLLEDRRGTIWIGTDRGLSAWRNGSFQQDAVTGALAREKVWSILEDASGTLWFGTRDHGLFRAHDGAVQQLTTEQGLPTNSIYQLLQDRHGLFWITGPNTIASVDAAQMDGALPSSDHPLSVVTYSMPFGAEDAQLYGGREPAGYLAPDDSVWFPTTRGLAHIQQGTSRSHDRSPRVVLLDVLEDGRPADLKDAVRVASGVTRLSFEFAATDLRPRNDLRFRYKLDNLDREWIPAGQTDVATYTNLKAGQYRFRVQAYEAGQLNNGNEVSFSFMKRRVFYQTWWFYVLCIVGLAGAAWAIYRLRLRQMRTRFAAVLDERNRLAREIHDTVIQGCTGLSAVLEAMAITSPNGDGQQSELLNYAREQTRATIHEARRAVWDMRHEREEDLSLLDAMNALAAQTMREHPEVEVQAEVSAVLRLRSSALQEVAMVLREAVGNAVQHSGTRRIELAAASDPKGLTVQVRDFGCGISEAEIRTPAPGHFGVMGMRERMKRLGGSLDVRVAAEGGTIVKLSVPQTHARRLEYSETA